MVTQLDYFTVRLIILSWVYFPKFVIKKMKIKNMLRGINTILLKLINQLITFTPVPNPQNLMCL